MGIFKLCVLRLRISSLKKLFVWGHGSVEEHLSIIHVGLLLIYRTAKKQTNNFPSQKHCYFMSMIHKMYPVICWYTHRELMTVFLNVIFLETNGVF